MQDEQKEGQHDQILEDTEDLSAKAFQQPKGVPLPELPEVEWSASEFIAHEKSANWYLALFLGSILIVTIVYFITQDFFASLVVFLSCLAIGIYASHQPATKSYSIDNRGVKVGLQFYSYSEFKSFSVVEDGAIDSVLLVRLKRFAPPIVMYFPPDEEDKILNTLANFLPHEQRELDAMDRLSRKFRF